MTEREKVIAAYICYNEKLPDKRCEKCPYGYEYLDQTGDDYFVWCNTARIMVDAIDLLKAQEPRVMTLEEVIERKDSDAVWVEHMDGEMIVQPAVLLPSFLDTDKDCIHFASSWRTGGSYGRRSYGTKWRCWTSRPTDDQREKEPWNG